MIKISSLLLSFVGIILIFKNDISGYQVFPSIVAIISGLAIGTQASVTKLISARYSSWQISIFSWASVFIFCIPISVYLRETQSFPEFTLPWLYLFLFACLGLCIFPILIYGYKRIDVTLAGLIGLLEIPSAIAFGFWFFNEKLTSSIILGSFLILIAAMLPDLHIKFKNLTKKFS